MKDRPSSENAPHSARFGRGLRRVLLSLLILIFCGMLVFGALNDRLSLIHVDLSGVTTTVQKPYFTWEAYWNGSHQKNYDAWIQENFPMRGALIRLYAQLRYDLFAKSPNKNVVVGKDGVLFEPWYITEYLQISPPPSEEQVRRIIEDVRFIQDKTEEAGKTFFLFITPSKCDFYSEYIPNSYYLQADSSRVEEERGYYKFVRLCDEYGIKYFDAHKWLLENRETIHAPVYASTGTHWNWVGSSYATAALVEAIYEQTGVRLRGIEVTGQHEVEEPVPPDADIFGIMNVLNGKMDDHYYYPDIVYRNIAGMEEPRIFWQGGSFSEEAITVLRGGNLFSDFSFMFQNLHTRFYNEGTSESTGVNFENVDLSKILANKNFIMLECNTAMTGNMGTGFPAFFRAYLEQHGYPDSSLVALDAFDPTHVPDSAACSQGFYAAESIGSTHACWMKERGRFTLKADGLPENGAKVRLFCSLKMLQDAHPDEKFFLTVRVDGKEAAVIPLNRQGVIQAEIPASAFAAGKSSYAVTLEASHCFVPQEITTTSSDSRRLSVMLSYFGK